METHYERRAFLLIVLGGSGVYAWATRRPAPGPALPSRVWIAGFDASGGPTGVAEMDVIRKSEQEWKKQLAPDSYSVTRLKDTELAGAGEYDRFYGDGIYRCICCGTAVFDSKAKFASGTGWPSFTEPIAKQNVVEAPSYFFGIQQTEVMCSRCRGHLGHVFDDGPPPTGMRYCINSVALRFNPRGT